MVRAALIVAILGGSRACADDTGANTGHGGAAADAGEAGSQDGGTGGQDSGGVGGSAGTGGSAAVSGDGGTGGDGDECASCADEHRECDSSGASTRCGACLPRYTEVDGTCVPLPDCEPSCPDGTGCFIGNGEDGGKCFSCDFVPACDDRVGQTGRVLARRAEESAECLCETKPGFYTDSSGKNAVPCDADGDGWVTQAAQPAYEGSDEVIRLNTRCTVRRISQVKLQNEAGAEYVEELSSPLPLYESVRNDGGTAPAHPTYGSRKLAAAALNSLTKACVSSTADFNDNGAADVSEWEEAELGRDLGWSSRLRSYFSEYARFAYFVELFNGFYESADGGTYRIVERRRTLRNGEGVPLVYPDGADEYWQSCPRHIDVSFQGTAASRAGGDLSAFDEDWDDPIAGGMTHTSQFKCVWLLDEDDYVGTYSLESDPEAAFSRGSSLARRTSSGATVTEAWSPNTCVAEADLSAGANSAQFPQFRCEEQAVDELSPGVYWMSVGFENYDAPEDYRAGCIDQCTERDTPVPECYGCAPESFGREDIEPLPSGGFCEAGVCDGSGHCGACVPATFRCGSETVQQVCSAGREWVDSVTCALCEDGVCYPECVPNTRQCSQNTPQSCDATGRWQSDPACATGRECVGAGVCLLSNRELCTSSDQCASGVCTTFYHDEDDDTYGGAAEDLCGIEAPLGYVTRDGDCCDSDANARPGQTSYFATARAGCGGFDYNCANGEEVGATACSMSAEGWIGAIPQCGQSANWYGWICVMGQCGCGVLRGTRTQGCR
jgi:hypothetical protein